MARVFSAMKPQQPFVRKIQGWGALRHSQNPHCVINWVSLAPFMGYYQYYLLKKLKNIVMEAQSMEKWVQQMQSLLFLIWAQDAASERGTSLWECAKPSNPWELGILVWLSTKGNDNAFGKPDCNGSFLHLTEIIVKKTVCYCTRSH